MQVNIPQKPFVTELLKLVALVLVTANAVAGECPAGTTQVGTREERINETTVVVHPQCKRNPKLATGWQLGLDCAMSDVYGRAEKFGADGVKFAADLRKEVEQFRVSAPGVNSGNSNDTDVTSLDLDRQLAVSNLQKESQFVVKVLVVRHGDGRVNVDVQSYLAGAEHNKADELQNLMIFDASGHLAKDKNDGGATVEMAQVSNAVNRCMGR